MLRLSTYLSWGPTTLICLKIILLFKLLRACLGSGTGNLWSVCICNFHHGSLDWPFVFLFNFYPRNLKPNFVFRSPSSPIPQFLIPLLSSDFPPKSREWHLNPSFWKCLKLNAHIALLSSGFRRKINKGSRMSTRKRADRGCGAAWEWECGFWKTSGHFPSAFIQTFPSFGRGAGAKAVWMA